MQFVAGLDKDMRMPPKGELLSAEQVGLLRAWIEQGAVWPDSASAKKRDPLDWWSLKPISKVTPTERRGNIRSTPSSARSWRKKDSAMAPEADRRTLIRRLYFDLIGLPPTPEEVDAFVADPDPGAYEKLVDRLLASPRYGERWARHWLDVVHYGDTHGYDKDQPRPNAWPYRDYVIRAFNADKPYAGSSRSRSPATCCFPALADGIEALGFIAAGPWDLIGHGEVPEAKIDGKSRPAPRPRRHGREHDRHVLQPDGPMCPVPQPQVRSDHAGGLLRAAGRLRRARPDDAEILRGRCIESPLS